MLTGMRAASRAGGEARAAASLLVSSRLDVAVPLRHQNSSFPFSWNVAGEKKSSTIRVTSSCCRPKFCECVCVCAGST